MTNNNARESKGAFKGLPLPVVGILMMAIAAAAFSVMHAIIRYVSVEVHPFEIAFFRAGVGILALMPIFLKDGFGTLKTTKLKLYTYRGAINAVAMLMFFYSLSITPLATVAALGFTAPVFATMLAMFFLGEKVGIRRWSAIIFGFIGTLVILRPGVIEIGFGPLLVLGSSLVWAVALMIIKVLTRTESSVSITAYAYFFLTPICLIASLPHWTWPSLEKLAWLAVVAVIGTIAQTAMNKALQLGDASTVLPVDFTKLLWAAAIGAVLFGEMPDMFTWIGGGMIFASATYIGIREARLKRAGKLPPGPHATPVGRDPAVDVPEVIDDKSRNP